MVGVGRDSGMDNDGDRGVTDLTMIAAYSDIGRGMAISETAVMCMAVKEAAIAGVQQ